jgi:hypothetical protein
MVQVRENALPVNILKRDVRRVGQTLRTICWSIQTRVPNVLQNLIFETIPKVLNSIVIGVFERETTRRAQSNDVRNCRSTRTSSLLLAATENE